MISTKTSPSEAKEYASPSPDSAPAYSYGTCLCLDTEILKRLGMQTPPPVGVEFTLKAKVVVTAARSSQEQGGEKRASSEMQITEMELGTPENPGPGAATVLYGGG